MINEFESEDEMIRLAAEGCYYYKKDRRRLAMSIVIERLVLPACADSYDEKEMTEYIRHALRD